MTNYSRLWLILIFSVITIFGLIRLGEIDVSLDTLRRINLGWFSLVVVWFYLSVVARGLRWYHILKTIGWPVGKLYATALLTTGLFTSSILPGRAGDIARVAMLKRDHQVPISKSVASIAAERAFDVFAILGMAGLAGAWALADRIPVEALQLMGVVAFFFIAGLVGLLVVPRLEHWLRTLSPLNRWAPPPLWNLYQKLLDFGFSMVNGVRVIGANPVALIAIVGESFIIWIFDALMVYYALASLDVFIAPSAALFTAMVSDLATAVPFTPGALGQFEATMVGLLLVFGVTSTDSTLATLIVRLVGLWTFLLVGGIVTYAFGFSRALAFETKAVEPNLPVVSASSSTESQNVVG